MLYTHVLSTSYKPGPVKHERWEGRQSLTLRTLQSVAGGVDAGGEWQVRKDHYKGERKGCTDSWEPTDFLPHRYVGFLAWERAGGHGMSGRTIRLPSSLP